jgi:hypothetical protein
VPQLMRPLRVNERIMIHTPGTPPAPAAQSRGIPPLFKADAVNIAVSASKDGKLRVVYAGRSGPAFDGGVHRPAGGVCDCAIAAAIC